MTHCLLECSRADTFQGLALWNPKLVSNRAREASCSRWLIGDGQKVKVWKDNWLPEQGKFKVWSPVKNLPQDAPVSELIDREIKTWSRTKVFNTFNSYEAHQIINIPISWRLPEDKRILHWERNGNYSVRSAYHSIQDDNSRENPEASSLSDQRLWRAVWKMHAPNRLGLETFCGDWPATFCQPEADWNKKA